MSPDLAWCVGRGFLLREIELAGCKLAHVALPEDETTAGLFLPVSKADVGGSGVLQMRICSHQTEPLGSKSCAVCCLRDLARLTASECDIEFTGSWPDEAWTTPLFITGELRVPEKEAVVKGWRSLCISPCQLTGHSARRSEAKELARRGWPIELISKLGRWGSAAILGYIEEAAA